MVGNVVGNIVHGEDFFDRVHELDRMMKRLETDDVLLLAPRRVGKSSLMHQVRAMTEARGDLAAYVSVAGASTERDFVQRLYEAAETWGPAEGVLAALAAGPLGGFMKRIKKVGAATVSIELADTTEKQWAELGTALAAALDSMQRPCLLLVDELPIFVLTLLRLDPTGGRARTFLNWFRTLRQNGTPNRHVRWLVAGSIGLDTVTHRLRLGDTINDLFLFNDLGAFPPRIADAFLTELGKSYRIHLSDDVKEHIRARVGWPIPYHLQLFFSKLRERCEGRSNAPSREMVDEVHEALLGPSNKCYFDYWEQRLTEELGPPDDRFAVELLNAVARNPDGATLGVLQGLLGARIRNVEERDRRLRYLLDVLQGDGYLVQEQGRFRFRSTLLHDFWTRRILP